MTDNQPSLQEIRAAFNNCCLASAFPGSQEECLLRLRVLREAKHTWVGPEENEFRFMVDHYLRNH